MAQIISPNSPVTRYHDPMILLDAVHAIGGVQWGKKVLVNVDPGQSTVAAFPSRLPWASVA